SIELDEEWIARSLSSSLRGCTRHEPHGRRGKPPSSDIIVKRNLLKQAFHGEQLKQPGHRLQIVFPLKLAAQYREPIELESESGRGTCPKKCLFFPKPGLSLAGRFESHGGAGAKLFFLVNGPRTADEISRLLAN